MKRKLYLVLDTETATLPFANFMCKTPQEKQKIAIAKPLVYDIGWTICDRNGNIFARKSYLVQETFFTPVVFNTAYYKDKRPIYMERFAKGEIVTATWNEIIADLLMDIAEVEAVCAYNACFDFKKAIPFTERYIKALYSADYQLWEDLQKKKCEAILKGADDSENPDYLTPIFVLRDIEVPIVDIWTVACQRLINTDRYRDFCLKNGLLTNSAMFFKSSAETSYQYLLRDVDFIEEHTALSDAEIETLILQKALKKGKVEPTLGAFPFRELGEVPSYVSQPNKQKYAETVLDKMNPYYETLNDTPYKARIEKVIEKLEMIVDEL